MTEPDATSPIEADLAGLGGWPALLTHLIDGNDLSTAQAIVAMRAILSGHATAAQLIAFAVALRIKGETAGELSALLDAVFEAAELVPLGDDLRARAVDIVGTGGDRSHSINVSTMAAIVVAAAGVPVCKHGNRGVSSECGTADVLEELGVVIEQTPAGVLQCVERAGIGFCFAPRFHPAFRFAGPARREVGIPLVFNLLGPMANPGRVRRQLIGVADTGFSERMLASLRAHGSIHSWVVNGGGLDELTTTAPSSVLALEPDGTTRSFTIDPAALGFPPTTCDQLRGGNPAQNANVVRRVLRGEPGPHRDIVVLNAGAALVVAGAVSSIEDGVTQASSTIDSGRAAATLESFVVASRLAAGQAVAAL